MNFLQIPFRAIKGEVSGDAGVAAALLLLMALVFAPVIGVHAAAVAFGTEAAQSIDAPSDASAKHRHG